MYAFKNGKNGDLFVQKAPSASLNTLTDALKDIFDKPNHPIKCNWDTSRRKTL